MATGDVLIMGDGKCIEGKYNKIRIVGSGELEGNITCHKLSSAGSASAKGNIYFDELKTAGFFEIDGSLEGKTIRTAGASEIRGSIKADSCKAYGMIHLQEDVETEHFLVRGAIEGAGRINSEKVLIQLLGACQVEEIGASEVEIGKKVIISDETGIRKWFNNNINMNFGDTEGSLIAKVIEGDRIYVDTAQVEVIRGEYVEIGPDCSIDKVEYTESISIDKGSKVGEIIQITAERKG
ncbi:MAG: hypothetical protein RR090_01420 [Niameybacter sp.]|uniref:hypothetical protein n=1 Tax=Niameybacter sp. TaxID=2033640 RepID=UPI002FCAE52D